MDGWSSYRKRGTVEARPYIEGERLPQSLSISPKDKEAGSPRVGDWIARDRNNPTDTWLISASYFEANYEQA